MDSVSVFRSAPSETRRNGTNESSDEAQSKDEFSEAGAVMAGTGGYLFWLDNGPPKTISDSSGVAVRYYRVIVFDSQT